jgi:hypothetical protein
MAVGLAAILKVEEGREDAAACVGVLWCLTRRNKMEQDHLDLGS